MSPSSKRVGTTVARTVILYSNGSESGSGPQSGHSPGKRGDGDSGVAESMSDEKGNKSTKKDMRQRELASLELQLGYTFVNKALLEQALTHSSLRHELHTAAAPGTRATVDGGDNERLEFLGDAIVGMIVAEALFTRFPRLSEGELTRLRAALVSRKHLGEVGEALELGRWLRMGRSEERNGGRKKSVLLANCVEAVTAALYLDSKSLEIACNFVEKVIVAPQAEILYQQLQAKHAIGDYKSALQEFLQARGDGQPEYLVQAETGPDHRKRFLVEVCTAATDPSGSRALAQGSGSTKKKAEQEAARKAFRKLGGENPVLEAHGEGDAVDLDASESA